MSARRPVSRATSAQSTGYLTRRNQFRQLLRTDLETLQQFRVPAAKRGIVEQRQAARRAVMSGASAEPRNHDVAHEPDTIGGLEQSRRFVVETQELADPQPGTATADVTQEPLAAEFGGEGLVKGPAALVEPTDHAPTGRDCASSICIAPP